MTRLEQAGGIVYRHDRVSRSHKVLVVSSLRKPLRWLFPKGDIDAGEKPERAARREVLEEAGAYAEVECHLGSVEYLDREFQVCLDFFLLSYLGTTGSYEHRQCRWVALDEATRLHHLGKAIRPIVRSAKRHLRKRLGAGP